jgi:hypothetical protein
MSIFSLFAVVLYKISEFNLSLSLDGRTLRSCYFVIGKNQPNCALIQTNGAGDEQTILLAQFDGSLLCVTQNGAGHVLTTHRGRKGLLV